MHRHCTWRNGGSCNLNEVVKTPKALITGITGQDGSYLAEMLVKKGYEIHGIVRRASQSDSSRFRNLNQLRFENRLTLHYADLSDTTALRRIITTVSPNEFYHLAGQSHVGLSFEIPESTFHEVAGATLSLLEICRDLSNPPRFYHAGSSEIFGEPVEVPQTEKTAQVPVSPYGCAKSFAVHLCRVYRESYGLFVSSGIAYNHESVRRGSHFVTKKIVSTVVKISEGRERVLKIGNLDSRRDWGYAPEFVRAMWMALQHENPLDFVLATGISTSLRDFVISAFSSVEIPIRFEGQDLDEKGIHKETGEVIVEVDPKFFRPADPVNLVGDPSLAKKLLQWEPVLKGSELACRLVKDEIEALKTRKY